MICDSNISKIAHLSCNMKNSLKFHLRSWWRNIYHPFHRKYIFLNVWFIYVLKQRAGWFSYEKIWNKKKEYKSSLIVVNGEGDVNSVLVAWKHAKWTWPRRTMRDQPIPYWSSRHSVYRRQRGGWWLVAGGWLM